MKKFQVEVESVQVRERDTKSVEEVINLHFGQTDHSPNYVGRFDTEKEALSFCEERSLRTEVCYNYNNHFWDGQTVMIEEIEVDEEGTVEYLGSGNMVN